MHLHPQGGEKYRRNLHGKFASAPQAQFLRTFLLGGGYVEGQSGLFSSFNVVVLAFFEGDE